MTSANEQEIGSDAEPGRPRFRAIQVAFTFLTTLPLSPPPDASIERDPTLFGRAFAWYPLVGLVIGLLLAALHWVLAHTSLHAPVQAGLLLGAWILITGGLHLDGLMDTCDALFAPVDLARRLAILKDVHTGAFGVLGVAWVMGMKWGLLTQLGSEQNRLFPALILAPVWGRWMLVWAAERFPYARHEASLGQFMRQGLTARQTVIASTSALLVQAGFSGVAPMLLWVLLAPLAGLILARWAAHRLGGGLTGDLYGALCEIVEMKVLLVMALL